MPNIPSIDILRVHYPAPSNSLHTQNDNARKNIVRNHTPIALTSMGKSYYVYILSNNSRMLYTGMTNDIQSRVYQHKQRLIDGFTKNYNLYQLVYYDETDDVGYAIKREKDIKGWSRKKKKTLIESMNPHWEDLAKDWYS